MPKRKSVSADAVRRALHALLDGRVTEMKSSPTTGMTDSQPRWIRVDVDYTNFEDKATTSTFALANLPAGTVCTHQWIEPRDPFVSPTAPIWRMSIVKAGSIVSAGGTAKDVDVTTPDALAQQHAAEHIASDSTAGPQDWEAQIDSGGTDNADDLTAGEASVYLLVSVPGATTDNLPHS